MYTELPICYFVFIRIQERRLEVKDDIIHLDQEKSADSDTVIIITYINRRFVTFYSTILYHCPPIIQYSCIRYS